MNGRSLLSRTLVSIFWVSTLALSPIQAQDDFLDESDFFDDDDGISEPIIADPLIGINRTIFKFNNFVYKNLLGPLARVYRGVTPDPIERGFRNFFNNLEYPIRLTGNLLQGKIEESFQETGKFLVNSTVGFAGFDDAAKDFPGLECPKEDLGQAFGAWGIGEGFYIVIPFLGPSNARDLVGRIGDRVPDVVATPWTVLDDSTDRLIVSGVDFVTESPELVYRYQSLTDSAIDPYEAMKDGFTQYRMQRIRE